MCEQCAGVNSTLCVHGQAHRNASEYIPILLAMLALIEGANFAHVAWIHCLGGYVYDVQPSH